MVLANVKVALPPLMALLVGDYSAAAAMEKSLNAHFAFYGQSSARTHTKVHFLVRYAPIRSIPRSLAGYPASQCRLRIGEAPAWQAAMARTTDVIRQALRVCVCVCLCVCGCRLRPAAHTASRESRYARCPSACVPACRPTRWAGAKRRHLCARLSRVSLWRFIFPRLNSDCAARNLQLLGLNKLDGWIWRSKRRLAAHLAHPEGYSSSSASSSSGLFFWINLAAGCILRSTQFPSMNSSFIFAREV